jgi:hypothetical protein
MSVEVVRSVAYLRGKNNQGPKLCTRTHNCSSIFLFKVFFVNRLTLPV